MNPRRAAHLANHLAGVGYAIQIVSVEAAQHVTSQGIAERWRNDHLDAEAGTAKDEDTARLGGRWVPSEIVADLYDDPENLAAAQSPPTSRNPNPRCSATRSSTSRPSTELLHQRRGSLARTPARHSPTDQLRRPRAWAAA